VKLRALRLYDVRQFAGRGVALEAIGDGLNSFAEPNETGKSTLFDALHELLFKKYTSKDAEVRALQPYTGGHPLIEADLETAAGLFRVRKRFLGRTLAEVTDLTRSVEIARHDKVQDWIDRQTGLGERDAGPAGLLWVRQGQSWSQSGGRDARGAALGALIADQLDTITVGARMRKVMNRTSEALGELVDGRGRPRTGGALAVAAAEVARLQEELAKLRARFDSLERDLADRERLRRDLEAQRQDPDAEAAERDRLANAEEAERTAAARAARLPDLRKLSAIAEAALTDAREALRTFVSERAMATDAARKIADLERRRTELDVEATTADAAVAKAGAERDAARAAEGQATAIWQAALKAERRESLTREIADLERTKDRAAKAAQDARTARADAALIGIDQAALDRIAAQHDALTKAETLAEAAFTKIEIAYRPGQAGRIATDDAAIQADRAIQIAARQTFEIDGIGRITVTPGGTDQAGRAHRSVGAARADLNAALAEAGMPDLAAARTEMARKGELLHAARQADGIVETLAPDGLVALEDALSRLTAEREAGVPDDVPDVAAAEGALNAAQRAHRRAEEGLARAEKAREAIAASRADLNDALGTARQALDRALSVTGPEAAWDARAGSLAEQAADREAELAERRAEVASLEDAEAERALAEAEVKRLRAAQRNRSELTHRLELDLSAIEQRFRNAADDGIAEALDQTREALEAARTRHARIALRAEALQMLDQALKDAHRAMRETYFEPVNRELRPLLKRVLGGETLAFDDTTFQPERLSRAGREEEIDRLSGGTQEQVAILTRLAFARLLARSGRAAPVILDDALIFSDDDRIESMFTVLNSMTDDLQIIVLTCRQRAFQSMGGRMLRLTGWTPGDA